MLIYTQAVDGCEHYLRVDPQSDWADEVRQRLATVKQKLEQREKSLAESLLTPGEITHAAPDDASLRDTIDRRIEEYLKVAVTDWLPEAFPESAQGQLHDAQIALGTLSAITRERHQDNWLT
jgi:hypothetical protein